MIGLNGQQRPCGCLTAPQLGATRHTNSQDARRKRAFEYQRQTTEVHLRIAKRAFTGLLSLLGLAGCFILCRSLDAQALEL